MLNKLHFFLWFFLITIFANSQDVFKIEKVNGFRTVSIHKGNKLIITYQQNQNIVQTEKVNFISLKDSFLFVLSNTEIIKIHVKDIQQLKYIPYAWPVYVIPGALTSIISAGLISVSIVDPKGTGFLFPFALGVVTGYISYKLYRGIFRTYDMKTKWVFNLRN